jgi:membrane-bound metal-dependent hydrolase YbcI (DUF457 family)
MDPLSHVVIGRALTAAVDDDIERFGRGGGAAAILGALAPDVDGILIPFGWDIYLRAHEIGTHSIAGCAVVACASAAIVRMLTRRSRYVPLAAAAATGAISHIALDVLSGARIRIGWPFLDARVTIPLVPMADPWFVAICVAGLCVYWYRRRTVARAVLVAAVGLLCVKGILLERMVRSSTGPVMSLSALEARWGSFTAWNVFERTPLTLRAWQVTSRGGPPALIVSRQVAAESALVRASRSLDTVSNFLRTHDFGFPVEQSTGGVTSVLWSDLRYCWPSAPSQRSISCSLWFGGTFGPDGNALTQVVKVGEWVQTRSASR